VRLTGAAAQTGPGQVTLTWTPPTDAGSSPISGYLVGHSGGEWGTGDEVGPRSAPGCSTGWRQASTPATPAGPSLTTPSDGAPAATSGPSLARTGGSVGSLAVFAALLLLMGAMLTASTRRRVTAADRPSGRD
jgi:hypothetical protein